MVEGEDAARKNDVFGEVDNNIRKRQKLVSKLTDFPQIERYKHAYKTDSEITVLAKGLNDSLVITGDSNGTVKFWKLVDGDSLSIIKGFKIHENEVKQLVLNHDESKLISVGRDDSKVSIFDLSTIDLIHSHKLQFVPNTSTSNTTCWFHEDKVLFSEDGTNHLYYVSFNDELSIQDVPRIHKFPILYIGYNYQDKFFVTIDSRSMIEIWDPSTFDLPRHVLFKLKSQSDLFDIVKNKQKVNGFCLSNDSKSFATLSSSSNLIRIFDVYTGKIIKKLSIMMNSHESKTIYFANNDSTLVVPSNSLELIDIEKDVSLKSFGREDLQLLKLEFNNSVLLNKFDSKTARANIMSNNRNNTYLPILVSIANKSNSLFVFSNNESELESRDVDLANKSPKPMGSKSKSTQAVLHTTFGDIKIQLFNMLVPKTVENFVRLSRKNYYNNVIFHRVIKKFMIQTGDPSGDGTGGESIWGGLFDDEFNMLLTHSKPFMVSMANAGPDTNGSQFFITTESANYLDNKHTVFGEVVNGFDVVKTIANAKTDKSDKPIDQIAIVSVTVTD